MQLLGIFVDTADGIVPNKVFKVPLPVIVMEYLDGGEMFDRIQERKSVSEKYLSAVFKDVMTCLKGLHARGYLHRDLKLENLMLTNSSKQSPVKIIDFGMMVEMDKKLGTYRSKGVQGTRGYVAPESITRCEYSPKTEVFQAGCTLYALLSGYQAFNPKRMDQVINGKYFKMVGPGWDNISPEGKDLVAGMLAKDPRKRLSVDEVLAHPWMLSAASEEDMGDAYYERIKSLVLKQKLKDFFLNHEITQGNKLRQEKLKAVVPFLKNHHRLKSSSPKSSDKSSVEMDPDSEEFDEKIRHLRDVVIRSYSGRSTSVVDDDMDVVLQPRDESRVGDMPRRLSKETGEPILDYEAFKAILLECGLPELANRRVFRIFDIGKNGEIDLKEFLVTMVAFRGAGEEVGEDGDEAEIRFYFNMFDINDSGIIDIDELRLAVQCILTDDTNPRCFMETFRGEDVDTLFATMDIAKNGHVDFEEFKAFFETVMIQSSRD